jgi:hypothetical protein
MSSTSAVANRVVENAEASLLEGLTHPELALEPMGTPTTPELVDAEAMPGTDKISPIHKILLLIPDLQASLLTHLQQQAQNTPPNMNTVTHQHFEHHLHELHKLESKIRTLHRENTALKAQFDQGVCDTCQSGESLVKGGASKAKDKGKGKAVQVREDEDNQIGSLFDDTITPERKPGIDIAKVGDRAFRLTEGEDPRAIAGELFDEIDRANSSAANIPEQIDVVYLGNGRSLAGSERLRNVEVIWMSC